MLKFMLKYEYFFLKPTNPGEDANIKAKGGIK
jgi:hypothetical protein